MRRLFLLISVTILFIVEGFAQTKSVGIAGGETLDNLENPLYSSGVACIYDYTQSLTDNEMMFNPLTDTLIHYLFISSDSSSFAVTPVENIDELLSSLCVWKDLLVVIHGYGDGIGKFTNREPLLSGLYDVDVLVFSWPALIKKGGKVGTFKATQENVDDVMPMFHKFLEELSGYVNTNRINCSLFFHSLGNRFAMLLGEEYASGKTDFDLSFVDKIVLNQACVPLKDYYLWAVPLSKQISGTLSITYNRRDIVLSIARSFSEKERQLGQGPTKKVPYIPYPT